MKSKLLRALGCAAYAGGLVFVFGLVAYLSFSLFVRSGVVRAPDLRGLSEQQAFAKLQEQGLTGNTDPETARYSERIPAGHVAQQDPGPGSLVKLGSPMTLVLSRGPQRVPVPVLADLALPAAQVALATAGLQVGRTLTVISHSGAPGAVVGQQPSPEETVAPETAVDLLVAAPGSGEIYVMPDVVYRDYTEVRRFFERRGFRLGNIRYESYDGVAEGVILRQYPLAGHPVSRRDAIALVVATAETTP